FFQAEDGIRDFHVTGVQTCALPIYLYFRLIDGGARVVHAADAVVVHPVRPAPWGVSLAQQRKVLYDALLFKKHRELYRERIRGRSEERRVGQERRSRGTPADRRNLQ